MVVRSWRSSIQLLLDGVHGVLSAIEHLQIELAIGLQNVL